MQFEFAVDRIGFIKYQGHQNFNGLST